MSDPLGLFKTDDPLGMFDVDEKPSILKTVALENPLTALGETALSMASGLPQFIASGAAMLGTMAAGGVDEESLDWAREQVPQWTKDITYEPKGQMGKATTQALGEGFKAVGEGLGATGAGFHAAMQAAINGGGQTEAQERFKKHYERVKPITRAAFDIAMAGKAAKAPYDMATNFKAKKQSDIKAKEDAAIEAALAKKQPQQKPVTEIENAPPVIPEDFVKQEQPFSFDKDLRPPVLPDQLKPLSEQYPQGIDIGTIEAGGPARVNTPLPELPPMTRDILSLAEEAVQRTPDTKRLATRHDIPNETIDFPLRQEVLESPEISSAIDAFRQEATKLENEGKLKELTELQNEFAAGMEQLGIRTPQEAIGLQPLYEGGKGKTRLPIEKSQGINRGSFGQSGAINPQILEGPIAAFANLIANITRDPKVVRDIVNRGDISPAERAIMISDAVKKSQLGGVGKKQGGAINFNFNTKETLPEFIERKKAEGSKATDDVLTEVYYKFNPVQAPEHLQVEAMSNIPGMDKVVQKYSSKPVIEDPTGEQAVARIQEVGTQDMPKAQSTFAKGLLSQGRLQAWKSNSPVVHEGIGFITSVKDHYRIQAANTLTEINKILSLFELSMPLVSKISWKDAWEVIRTRRNNEFNPEYDPTQHFTGKQLELHQAIDKTMADIHTKLNQRLKELNPERTEDLTKIPYYFTSFFIGDFSIPIFDAATGKFLFNLRETTKHSANLAADHITKHNPELRVGNIGSIHKESKAGIALDKRGYSVLDFEQMMDVLGRQDPLVQRALNSITARQTGAAKQTADMPSRFMYKEGRVGSLGDKPWLSERQNFIESKKALEMYVEGANDWLANTQISMFTKQLNKADGIDAPNAMSMINDYANYVIGGKNSNSGLITETTNAILNGFGVSRSTASTAIRKWSNANTALLIGWYSPRAMVQNVLQPIQVMPPRLQKLKFVEGVDGNISYALVRGLYEGIRDIVDHWKDSDYVSSTRAFMEDNHVVDAHLVELGNMFGSAKLNAVYDISANKSLAWTEQLSRSISFNQSVAFFESAGYPRNIAMDMAKNITHETMVNYETSAKPQIFGSTGLLGETAGRLQTFKMNDLTQTLEYMRDAKSANPKNWIPISTKLGTTILFAGITGMVGMDVLELLWQGLQAIDEKGENKWLSDHTLKGLIYESMPLWASKGVLSASTGIDLSGSFAQNLVGENPLQSIAPIAGTMYEQAMGLPKVFSDKNMTKAQGLNALLPSVARGKIERELLTNPTDDGQTQVVSPYTGKTAWKGKGQQMYGNLRSLERGNYGFENREQSKFAQNVNESKAAVTKAVQQYTVNLYQNIQKGEDTQQSINDISKQLHRFYEFGGDPEILWNGVEKQLEDLAVGDEIINQLRQEVTLSNRKVWMEASKVQEKRKTAK